MALDRAVAAAPEDAVVLSTDHVRSVLEDGPQPANSSRSASAGSPRTTDAPLTDPPGKAAADQATTDPSISPGTAAGNPPDGAPVVRDETGGSTPAEGRVEGGSPARSRHRLRVAGDVTGRSTGTGEYEDFLAVFRDRYQRLSRLLRGRVNHRPAEAVDSMPGGSDAAMIGLVSDIRPTSGGHRLVELEDTTGTVQCMVLQDRDISSLVDELLLDEAVAVEGTLADDGGVMFADTIHFPDVPRTHTPTTATRHVRTALVSDLHVGSREFLAEKWSEFASWLHSEAADRVEYLLVAGDMVEGVGVYPGQDEEVAVVDIYEQYELFAEHLKEVPGDIDIVLIPGNHDAVRLAEPQPAFDEELREVMSAHDARIHGNPATVTIEDVSFLMYHGVSLDEVIAELPAKTASYDEPHRAMFQLLRKRHLAPQFGGHTRLAPEERDYLVIEDVPDVFHAGHTHTFGIGKYHGVLTVNSGCWQAQTSFQRSVNIDPDAGFAPIVDLDTLEVEVMSF